jgi:hypothetical protein
MTQTVILYNKPQGEKTKHAKAIARHYGCEGVVFGWTPEKAMWPGQMHITHLDYSEAQMALCDADTGQVIGLVKCVSYTDALAAISANEVGA